MPAAIPQRSYWQALRAARIGPGAIRAASGGACPRCLSMRQTRCLARGPAAIRRTLASTGARTQRRRWETTRSGKGRRRSGWRTSTTMRQRPRRCSARLLATGAGRGGPGRRQRPLLQPPHQMHLGSKSERGAPMLRRTRRSRSQCLRTTRCRHSLTNGANVWRAPAGGGAHLSSRAGARMLRSTLAGTRLSPRPARPSIRSWMCLVARRVRRPSRPSSTIRMCLSDAAPPPPPPLPPSMLHLPRRTFGLRRPQA